MKKILALLSIVILVSCKQEKLSLEIPSSDLKGKVTFDIMSYNVENLFDTIDDSNKADEDFTPTGKLKWNSAKYYEHLNHTVDAITNKGANFPAVVGLIEVENGIVLNDLVNTSYLKGRGYQVVWFEGPDERGIDVALIYDSNRVNVTGSRAIPVVLESVSDPNTRDILKVTVKVGNEDFNLFVNHWPSRRGGQDESEMHRIKAASVLRKEVDVILSINANANIICMGDFNDFPSNKSVHDVLQAGVSNEHSVLFNMMADFETLKKGTHFYKGEWSPLDQFMVSYGMFDNKCISANSFDVVSYDFLYYTSKEGVRSPARAYVGDSYKGGYSDHLPILMHVN
jgi:predicted extracellular nuclease